MNVQEPILIIGQAQAIICMKLGLPVEASFNEILAAIDALKAVKKPRSIKHSIIKVEPNYEPLEDAA